MREFKAEVSLGPAHEIGLGANKHWVELHIVDYQTLRTVCTLRLTHAQAGELLGGHRTVKCDGEASPTGGADK